MKSLSNPSLSQNPKKPVSERDKYIWTSHRKLLTPAQHKVLPLYTFGYSTKTKSIGPLESHFHQDCLEVVVMIKGFQVYEVENSTFNMSGGDIFVTYPGEVHSTSCYPESPNEHIWFQLDLVNFPSMFGLDPVHTTQLKNSLVTLPRIFRSNKELIQSLKLAFTNLSSSNPLNRTLGEYSFLCCLYQLLLSSEQFTLPHTDTIDMAITYIHDHIYDSIQLEDLAKHCSLSLSHFKSLFRKKMGVTPRSFINHVKIEQAKVLLKNHSITETSNMLSFDTPNYFATVFKKYEEVTPSQYISRIQP